MALIDDLNTLLAELSAAVVVDTTPLAEQFTIVASDSRLTSGGLIFTQQLSHPTTLPSLQVSVDGLIFPPFDIVLSNDSNGNPTILVLNATSLGPFDVGNLIVVAYRPALLSQTVASIRWTDAQKTLAINHALAVYSRRRPFEVFDYTSIQLLVGIQSYTLPSNVQAVTGVEYFRGSLRPDVVSQFVYPLGYGTGSRQQQTWEVQNGTTLYLYPPPLVNASAVLRYVRVKAEADLKMDEPRLVLIYARALLYEWRAGALARKTDYMEADSSYKQSQESRMYFDLAKALKDEFDREVRLPT